MTDKKGQWGGHREGAGRPKTMDAGRRRSVQFPEDDLERLEAIAEKEKVKVSMIIRQAVSDFLRRYRPHKGGKGGGRK